jgi:acyl dehydratase
MSPDRTEFRTNTADQFIGKELAVSDWLTIDQNMVTTFATTTLDPDWMHVE